ncbi:cupredoxin domain-containing protein [Paenibacillus aestuarii]|uniref:Cupredoxin domain-containing protein n=1 Tax=Paenibacillus aestuarii TaxID=516965 RepID=A0ABW0KEN3_9BACL|nr:cupredoxin domain-containing protein [Paenibacillus aestuarii]
MKKVWKNAALVAMLVMIVSVFAACGKDEGGATSGTLSVVKEITLQAKNFEFDQKEIRVKKGDKVKITLENAQGSHSVKIEGYDKTIQAGKSVTFTADKTGEFKFACDLFCGQGHGDMTGKLIVE